MAANLAGIALIPYYTHLMEILDTNVELRRTARGIYRQVAWAAGGVAVGGVLGGPPGAMVGGVAGCVLGYYFSSDYDSLVAAIRNLTDEDKERIAQNVQELVGAAGVEALINFIGSQVNRKALLNLLRKFASDVNQRG